MVKGIVTISELPTRVSAQALAKCSWSGKKRKRIIGFQGFPWVCCIQVTEVHGDSLPPDTELYRESQSLV